jgi:hypothetical protein
LISCAFRDAQVLTKEPNITFAARGLTVFEQDRMRPNEVPLILPGDDDFDRKFQNQSLHRSRWSTQWPHYHLQCCTILERDWLWRRQTG